MNIGIVTTWFERGGAYVSRQYLEILRKEFNVFIYARGGEEYAKKNPTWDNDHVRWGKKAYLPISTALDLGDFRRWLLDNSIEVVLFNEQQWWLPVIRCKQWKIKTVAYIDYYTSRSIELFGLYDAVICNTKRHYQAFQWHPSAKYVPWGTDVDVFKYKRSGLASGGIVTFFHNCGYDPIRKNTAMVIRCFSKISVPARLIVHSQVDILRGQVALEELVNRLISNGKMEYVNKTISAPGLYGLGDVYVYPSMSDGIGLTLAEALSSGLCCISTDNAPMNEFATDGTVLKVKVKYLFTEHGDPFYWPKAQLDEEDLFKKMEFCAVNPEWVVKAKTSAREYAEYYLNWSNNTKAIVKIFKDLSGPCSASPELVRLARIFDREHLPYDSRITALYRIYRGIDLILKGIGRSISSI